MVVLPNESQFQMLESQIEQVFIGKDDVVRLSLTTFLAGGHLLIEDVPGVGKTTLALSLAKTMGGGRQSAGRFGVAKSDSSSCLAASSRLCNSR